MQNSLMINLTGCQKKHTEGAIKLLMIQSSEKGMKLSIHHPSSLPTSRKMVGQFCQSNWLRRRKTKCKMQGPRFKNSWTLSRKPSYQHCGISTKLYHSLVLLWCAKAGDSAWAIASFLQMCYDLYKIQYAGNVARLL